MSKLKMHRRGARKMFSERALSLCGPFNNWLSSCGSKSVSWSSTGINFYVCSETSVYCKVSYSGKHL